MLKLKNVSFMIAEDISERLSGRQSFSSYFELN